MGFKRAAKRNRNPQYVEEDSFGSQEYLEPSDPPQPNPLPEFLRFPSPQAAERYNSNTQYRALLMERGFAGKPGKTLGYPQQVQRTIIANNWTHFCGP